MKFNFDKYQGAGNDFIIIDDRSLSFPKDNASIINQLCNRHMGVGADGLILVQNSTEGDFKMIYFNSDGNQGSLCGNGGRCVFAFARSLNKPFIAVNHLEGHALSPGLDKKIEYPYLLLLISGGHSQFLIVKDVGSYQQLGTTIDLSLIHI